MIPAVAELTVGGRSCSYCNVVVGYFQEPSRSGVAAARHPADPVPMRAPACASHIRLAHLATGLVNMAETPPNAPSTVK
jgi:hypothetical protein